MMFNTSYGSGIGIRATIRPPGTEAWRKVKRLAARAMTERVRNAAISIYELIAKSIVNVTATGVRILY